MSGGFLNRIPYVLVLLGGAGFAIGSYLTIAHWGDQPIACAGVGDCGYVNSSEYASIGGVPVSGLGSLLYLAMTLTALAWSRRSDVDWLPIAYWGLALAGAGYAAYLTYVELWVLHAICVWCVTSAVLLTLSLVLASVAVFFEPVGVDDETTPARMEGLRIGAAPESE